MSDRVNPRTILLAAVIAGLASVVARPLEGQATLVIIARHGEKADTTQDTPLSPAGEARAAALARALADTRLDAVFVTEFVRTQRTGGPAAAARGLNERIIPVHDDSIAHARTVAAALRAERPGSAVLVVEHSNTIPLIISALGGPGGVKVCRLEYATLFVMVLDRGRTPRLLRSRFGAADPPGAGCAPGMAPGGMASGRR
jgi:broad specificity phosphatase PhoE